MHHARLLAVASFTTLFACGDDASSTASTCMDLSGHIDGPSAGHKRCGTTTGAERVAHSRVWNDLWPAERRQAAAALLTVTSNGGAR